MSDAMPNFDAMSPEEIMAWMESLAKRQGANEGFTTAADVDIPEVDPDTAVIDEPGYIPSEGKMKGQRITSAIPPSSKPAAAAPALPPAPQRPSAAPPPPMFDLPPAPAPKPATPSFAAPSAAPKFDLPPAPAPKPATPSFAAPSAAPKFDLPPAPAPKPVTPSFAAPPPPPPAPEPVAEPLSSLSWLESLAAEQNNALPSFDLSGFAAPPAPPVEDAFNPADWLAGLSQAEVSVPDLPFSAEAPINEGDTINWLETLARRQGADDAELVTPANMDIPPQESFAPAPQYSGFSFDSPTLSTRPEVKQEPPVVPVHEDAGSWLDSLGLGNLLLEDTDDSGAEEAVDDAVMDALERGEDISSDKMEAWMHQQLQLGAARPDPEALLEPEEPQAVPAEIPDWLIEQTGGMPAVVVPEPPKVDLNALLGSPSDVSHIEDIPDWLRDEEQDTSELDAMFVVPIPPQVEVVAPAPVAVTPPAAVASDLKIDLSDPWAEAFEHEYAARQGETRPIASVASMPVVALPNSELAPESELSPGEPQSPPAWASLSGAPSVPTTAATTPATEAVVTAAEEADISNWLATLDAELSDVPAWLTETLTTSEQPVPSQAPLVAAPAFTLPAPAFKPVSRPQPAPTNVNAEALLSQARSSANSSDIDGALGHYEMLVRANAAIEEVSADLARLADKVKTSPAVLRVWGDALARQGKLQSALDTYRKALNQL